MLRTQVPARRSVQDSRGVGLSFRVVAYLIREFLDFRRKNVLSVPRIREGVMRQLVFLMLEAEVYITVEEVKLATLCQL